jgi:hypothetical protein
MTIELIRENQWICSRRDLVKGLRQDEAGEGHGCSP